VCIADALGVVGAGLGLLGVILALAVPIGIELARRPVLRIERADDANSPDPCWRIVHVRVINEPLRGWRGRFLLRNSASGCRVAMEFRSLSDGKSLPARGKWSANAEPLMIIPDDDDPGRFRQAFDLSKIPQTLTLDVSPSADGEPVAIAIKHNGDAVAYAFDPWLYAGGNLRNEEYALPHEQYEVTVTARAGGIGSEPRRFLLHNDGTEYRDLRLENA
jgi:hypothetical protein